MRALIIDTETTSLIDNHLLPFDKQPEVVEFFGVLIDLATGEVQQEYETLIKPSRPLTEETIRITHITPELLADAPPFDAVLPDINTFLAGADMVIGHNLSFDMEILDLEFERRGATITWPARKICTVEQTVHLKGFRLNLTALHETLFNEPFPEAHRARHDVQATARCACELFKRGELVLGYGGITDVGREPIDDVAVTDAPIPDVVITDAVTILHGDCLAVMRTLVADSVDAIVTDPPAGIKFMGKSWDGDKGGRDQWIAWMQGVAEEAMRVLKPGGHALVWALPRTSHWTATAWENAGFEVRDRVAHVFGSGFPKSHDVSAAIDRMAGAEREVVGRYQPPNGTTWNLENDEARSSVGPVGHSDRVASLAITAPATAAAREWQGWGSALKPAVEDWHWFQKPNPVVCADIVIEANLRMELLLWSIAPVKLAEKFSESSQSASSEALSAFAQWIADEQHGLKRDDLSALMATFNSPEMAATFLSIASSWRSILAADWSDASTSTTGTETGLTIGLRILNSCLLGITPDFTVPDPIQRNGGLSYALDAEPSLSEWRSLLSSIRERFALKTVTIDTLRNVLFVLVGIAESSSGILRVESESTVPRLVIGPRGKALSPSVEDWWLLRKPLSEKTVAANVLRHGTGALNIDGCRVGTESTIRTRYDNHSASGWGSVNRSPVGGSVSGRWPSHLILGYPEDEYELRADVTSAQKQKLFQWLGENA